MSCRSNIKPLVVATIATVLLAGCSDIYFDRRDTISPAAGDAQRANQVTHMVDPWPRASENRNIAFNGEVMQQAVERYREGRVIPPTNATTSSAAYARAQATAASAQSQVQRSTAPAPTAPPSTWAGAPVKQP